MKGKHVAADASVAYVEGEHGTSAANTMGYTPATVCLQLPTSPVVDPPGAAPVAWFPTHMVYRVH
jgi:hypothetical protein